MFSASNLRLSGRVWRLQREVQSPVRKMESPAYSSTTGQLSFSTALNTRVPKSHKKDVLDFKYQEASAPTWKHS